MRTTCRHRASGSPTMGSTAWRSRRARDRARWRRCSRPPASTPSRFTASARAAASCCRPTTRSNAWSRSGTSTASRCVCLSGRARTGTSASRRPAAPAECLGSSLRGADQVSYGIEDVRHAATLGIRSVLVADIGQLMILARMKTAGDLPPDFVLKVSVTLAAGNPASARVLEGSRARRRSIFLSICRCRRLRPSVKPSMRRSISTSRRPDDFGGTVRHYEIPELVRIAAPIYLEVRPAQRALDLSERTAYRVDGAGFVSRTGPPRGDRPRAPATLPPGCGCLARRGARVTAPNRAISPSGAMPAMKVTDVRVTVVGAPWRELVFVELTTDTGLVGVGEIRIVNKTSTLVACIEELAPRYVIGSDPFDVERLAWNILQAEYGRPEEITQSALAAFDVASWDIIGQALGVPVWRLLGGRMRDRVPAYANGWYQADRDPKAVAALARTRRRARVSRVEAGPVRRRQRGNLRRRFTSCGGRARRGARCGRPGHPDHGGDARPLHTVNGRADGGASRTCTSPNGSKSLCRQKIPRRQRECARRRS